MSCLISFSSPEEKPGAGAERREQSGLIPVPAEAKIHLCCRRVLLTFGYLVALSVRLGFDDVALYESLHDLLQAAFGNKKRLKPSSNKRQSIHSRRLRTWYLVGLLEVPYEHRLLSTPSCKVKMNK